MLQFTEEKIFNDAAWEVEGSSKVRLVHATPNLDQAVGYVARVSSKNEENPSVERLLRYCADHGHHSVFESGSITMEVVTPLAISVQLIRHRSFTFQQFSGRYQDQTAMTERTEDLPTFDDVMYLPYKVRMQDTKNRQNSIKDVPGDVNIAAIAHMEMAYMTALSSYNELLKLGVGKEIARFVLPQGVYSRLYITGSPRSFIHYCAVRDDEGVAQWEHVELARAIKRVFALTCPTIAEAVWAES